MGRVLREVDHTIGARRLHAVLSLSDDAPPDEHVSAAHCLAFDDDGRFLLTRHVERQWTIPGGHREPGESAEDALRREALEEAAAVIVDPVLLAVERIDLAEGDPDPRYPNPAFQVFYVARVAQLDVLVPNAECTESRVFDVEDARRQPGWVDHNHELFDAAVASWSRRGR